LWRVTKYINNMSQFRNSKGQFISEDEAFRNFIRTLAFFTITPFVFWFLSTLNTTHVWESDVIHAKEIDPSICDLLVVQCEGEEEPDLSVERAIEAVNTALGKQVTDETRKRISYLYSITKDTDVPFFDAVKTVYCESMWYSVKSYLPEESYGLSQIHVPSHPHITPEQALDPYFALDFLVTHWHHVAWYGYDRTTGQCTNNLRIYVD
jgi:hypothetical protein